MFNFRLHLFSKVVAGFTFLLIVAGGLVTSTGSGLSVPDWPLSYGQFFPPMIGGIRFEHTHRVIASIVGFLTLFLAVGLLVWDKRRWVKVLGVLALLMVIAQAILGGLTVIYLLPDPISVTHACLGQVFFALICLLVFVTSKAWFEQSPVSAKRAGTIQRLLWTTCFFVYLQLILGATIRHTQTYWGLYYHFFTAFMILVHIIFAIPKVAKEKPVMNILLKPTLFLAALVASQIFLGLGAYIYKLVFQPLAMPRTAEVLFATAHQTNGALILATIFVLSVSANRFLVPKGK